MSISYLRSVERKIPAPFSAGDFIEGLSFLDPGWRAAVVFGMEQQLTCNEVITITSTQVSRLALTPLSTEIVKQQPRHIRTRTLFWHQLESGMVLPLVGLDRAVTTAFGGVRWSDLLALYKTMIWVDFEFEALHFKLVARDEDLLKRT